MNIKYGPSESCKGKSVIIDGMNEGMINNRQQANEGINGNTK